jgi:hypothetical protein
MSSDVNSISPDNILQSNPTLANVASYVGYVGDTNKNAYGIFGESSYLKSDNRLANVIATGGNRLQLLSTNVAREFNTYLNFGIFPTFADTYPDEVYDVTGNTDPNTIKDTNLKYKTPTGYGPGTPGVRSLFNRAGAVIVGSQNGSYNIDPRIDNSMWRLSNNVPLMDSPYARYTRDEMLSCKISDLVAASRSGLMGQETYDWSDFMYCKHLGRVSNNYLVTLRRFPSPVDDFIGVNGDITAFSYDGDSDDSETSKSHLANVSKNPASIGCMVTWLGVSGNEMASILKYSFKMPFKEQQSQLEDSKTDADTNSTLLGGLFSAFDKSYQKQYMAGRAGESANAAFSHFGINLGNPPYTDHRGFKDRNKVYGPIDAVKSTYIRSDEGLVFKQSMTLVFEYELRSYNGINPRQAMLDLISNILNVTYITGSFWGGGIKSYGASQSNIFTNLKVFKCKGGFTDFADAMAEDLTTIGGNISKNLGFGDGQFTLATAWKALKGALNTLGGMIMAGMLNKLGRPQKAMYNSLLSPAPIGFWHVTIGNPRAPIMSIGNMVITNVKIEHSGPLGIDDFPTDLKVTIDLDRGKPRDIREIEKIYMHGNDRIYAAMTDKVFNMYHNSGQYKASLNNIGEKDENGIFSGGVTYDPVLKTKRNGKEEDLVIYGNTGETSETSKSIELKPKDNNSSGTKETTKYSRNLMGVINTSEETGIGQDGIMTNFSAESAEKFGEWAYTQATLRKYFGTNDIFSIYFASTEQEYGASNTEKAVGKDIYAKK